MGVRREYNFILLGIFSIVVLGSFGFQDAHAANMTFATDTTISTSMTIADGETWTVNNGVILTINPGISIFVADGGTINNNGIIFNSAIINNLGIILNSDLITNTVAGIIRNNGAINNTGIIDNFGNLHMTFGEILNYGDIVNTGTISPGDLLVIETPGLFINSGSIITFNILENSVGPSTIFLIVDCGLITGPISGPVEDCTADFLIELIEDSNLAKKVEKPLIAPLKIVSRVLNDGKSNNDPRACDKLDAFISKVEFKVDSGDLGLRTADDFIDISNALKDENTCQ